MRMTSLFLLCAFAAMCLFAPVNIGITHASASGAECIINLNVCHSGSAQMTASGELSYIAQASFSVAVFETPALRTASSIHFPDDTIVAPSDEPPRA